MLTRKRLPITTLGMWLTVAGLAWAVRRGPGADSHSQPAEPSVRKRTAAEAQIWALEQAYWQFNRDADHERIIATWHDRFLGWPDGEPKPIDKERGARYVRKNYAKPAAYTFQIEPTGIRFLGNVAVNYYQVHLTSKDPNAKETKRSMRITHTWVRHGATWRILGGMSDSE